MMTTKVLGNSDMALTAVGFGAWAIGGADYAFGWGSQEDTDSIGAIRKAVDLGVNWVDTAAIYGLGHSEEVVGQALKEIGGKKPYVFTKCSMRWNEKREIYRSLTAEGVRWECEQSLKRLGVETIDLYQIHWPDPDAEIEEGWGEMQKLKEEGKIRWAGVSNFSVAQMKRAQGIGVITSLQPPYSLINRRVGAEVLPFCLENGIGVINYSPMVSGLLTGKMTAERLSKMADDDWRKKSPNFNEPKLSKNLSLADLLGEIGKKHGVETGVVAVAWTLNNPAITAAIVGGRNAEQVEGTSKALTFRLTGEEIAEIDSFVKTNEIGNA
ncbi:aldo/keto reductase [Granulicella tundricola]|nr:aldo/keto reductase [Granulicella tundricola]